MSQKKQMVLVLMVLPFCLFMSDEEESHSSNSLAFIGKVVNFVILFGGLAFLLYKPIRQFFEKRAQNIDGSIKEAHKEKKASEARLEKARRRLDNISKEIGEIKKMAESKGQEGSEEILRVTRSEAERIKQFTRQEIDALHHAGIKELREHTAEIVSALTLKRIQKKITSEDRVQFIDKSIERLEKVYERSSSR